MGLRSGAGVEPTERGAATPHWFLTTSAQSLICRKKKRTQRSVRQSSRSRGHKDRLPDEQVVVSWSAQSSRAFGPAQRSSKTRDLSADPWRDLRADAGDPDRLVVNAQRHV